MNFTAFHALFEKIAAQQTRSLSLRNDPEIPDGDYALMPMYCNDKKCDCRRALINVLQVSPEFRPFHATTLSYGWEPMSFYKKWGAGLDDKMLKAFKGPAVDYFNQQSPYSEALLKIFVKVVLDEDYIQRLQRQYAMVKFKTGMRLPPELTKLAGLYEPCPCGSGDTFKMCCGKTNSFVRRFKSKR